VCFYWLDYLWINIVNKFARASKSQRLRLTLLFILSVNIILNRNSSPWFSEP